MLEEFFDNWINSNLNYQILFIKYSKLNENFDKIEKYLGFELNRIKFQYRIRSKKNNVESLEENKLNKIYKNLNEKIDKIPDIFIKEAT